MTVKKLQTKTEAVIREFSKYNFVAYVDALGELDGTPCVLEWKTTSARYPDEPAGIPLLIRNWFVIWMIGIDELSRSVSVGSAESKSSTCKPR